MNLPGHLVHYNFRHFQMSSQTLKETNTSISFSHDCSFSGEGVQGEGGSIHHKQSFDALHLESFNLQAFLFVKGYFGWLLKSNRSLKQSYEL